MRGDWKWMGLLLGCAAALPMTGLADERRGAEEPVQNAMELIESKDAYERQLGFLRLEALRDPGTLAAVRAYAGHKDPEVRALAVRAMAAIGGGSAVPELMDAAQRDRHPAVRRAALLGLEPLIPAHPQMLPVLFAALRDRKPEVRMTAVDIVSRIQSDEAREAIRERRRRERDRNVQRVLTLAIRRIGDG
jgi:HEAT repeat protein